MSYLWASVLLAFLPTSLLLGAHWANRQVYTLRFLVFSSCAAIAAGALLSFYLPKTQLFALRFSIVQAVLWLGFLLWQFCHRREYFWHTLLVFLAALHWGKTPALMSLSATHVINTELILNLGSVVVAIALCIILAWLIYLSLLHVRWLRWPVLATGAALVLIPLSGQIMLALMKLRVLDLTKTRLSYVGKTTNLSQEITCVALLATLLVAVAVAVCVVAKKRRLWRQTQELIGKRLARAAYERTRALCVWLAVVVAVMGSGQWYWTAVASQPPRLSDAVRVMPDSDGQVRLAFSPLMDGRLHRFAWVADDGRLVRFFVINRLQDRQAPAVVFDACLLCGDKGYVQNGDQVTCVGCGVYLFKPSIGKPGGCNPVPIEGWQVEEDQIVIPRQSLEKGLNLFSTVLTIDVVDPVSGKQLTNTTAAFHYTYGLKTYFFADEASYEAFKADPERYIAAEPPVAQQDETADASEDTPERQKEAP